MNGGFRGDVHRSEYLDKAWNKVIVLEKFEAKSLQVKTGSLAGHGDSLVQFSL